MMTDPIPIGELLMLLAFAWFLGYQWAQLRAWKKRSQEIQASPEPKPPPPQPGHLDRVDKATLNYHVTMAFVEGSTLQDITAAGASSVAIWAARCADTHGLDQTTIEHGRYRVETEITVKYDPLADDESAVPIFDGAALVRMLESSQRGF